MWKGHIDVCLSVKGTSAVNYKCKQVGPCLGTEPVITPSLLLDKDIPFLRISDESPPYSVLSHWNNKIQSQLLTLLTERAVLAAADSQCFRLTQICNPSLTHM